MKSDESEEINAFCWCCTLTTPLQIETCNFSTEGKFVEFNMRLMGNLGNSSFYSNCMLFLVGNVIFFPLIVSRKRPAVLNFSYGRGWGGGLRGAQGTLLPLFLGAGCPSIIYANPLCPWYLIICPLEIHFCIYEAVNQILLTHLTFHSNWLKDLQCLTPIGWKIFGDRRVRCCTCWSYRASSLQIRAIKKGRKENIRFFIFLKRAQWYLTKYSVPGI